MRPWRGAGREPGRRRGTALSAPPTTAASRSESKGVCVRAQGTRGGSGGQGQGAGPCAPNPPGLPGHPREGAEWLGFILCLPNFRGIRGKPGSCSGGSELVVQQFRELCELGSSSSTRKAAWVVHSFQSPQRAEEHDPVSTLRRKRITRVGSGRTGWGPRPWGEKTCWAGCTPGGPGNHSKFLSSRKP